MGFEMQGNIENKNEDEEGKVNGVENILQEELDPNGMSPEAAALEKRGGPYSEEEEALLRKEAARIENNMSIDILKDEFSSLQTFDKGDGKVED